MGKIAALNKYEELMTEINGAVQDLVDLAEVFIDLSDNHLYDDYILLAKTYNDYAGKLANLATELYDDTLKFKEEAKRKIENRS